MTQIKQYKKHEKDIFEIKFNKLSKLEQLFLVYEHIYKNTKKAIKHINSNKLDKANSLILNNQEIIILLKNNLHKDKEIIHLYKLYEYLLDLLYVSNIKKDISLLSEFNKYISLLKNECFLYKKEA